MTSKWRRGGGVTSKWRRGGGVTSKWRLNGAVVSTCMRLALGDSLEDQVAE